MDIVQKGNKQLTVADTQVNEYLKAGYDLIKKTSDGVKVAKKATGGRTYSPSEVAEYQYKIAQLEQEKALLQDQLRYNTMSKDELLKELDERGLKHDAKSPNSELIEILLHP